MYLFIGLFIYYYNKNNQTSEFKERLDWVNNVEWSIICPSRNVLIM